MNKQPDRLPADDECHCDRCEGNRAAPDLMPLIGARMVSVSEPDAGAAYDDLVHALCGKR